MKISLTGIVHDKIFLKHNQTGHPENAGRLESIITLLIERELIQEVNQIDLRPATEEEMIVCHSKEYIKYVEEFCKKGGGYLDPDTYSNKHSFETASLAVGTSLDLMKVVINGKLKNGFALIRPPGHHALASRSMGFCLFGNIAIAAKIALQHPGIKKVAIVDFDVHHGNGTQSIVGDDPDILFISSHQYPFYPGTGSIREIGTGKAEGTNINIPFLAGIGDNGFRLAYEEIVIPSLERFNPDLILVSAGYDAHWDDPLAELNLSLTGFDWISRVLINAAEKLCDGKIIFFLEGGYNFQVLSNGVANTITALLGIQSFSDPIGQSNRNEPEVERLVNELKKIHKIDEQRFSL